MLNTAITLHKKIRYSHNKETYTRKSREMNLIRCEGMNNFSFHVTAFILVFIMTSLNFMPLVAWMKDSSVMRNETDSSLVPSIIVVTSLCALWFLMAPTKMSSFGIGNKAFTSLLYMSASASIIFGQEALHQLNFVIAFVFILLLVQEVVIRFSKSSVTGNRKNK